MSYYGSKCQAKCCDVQLVLEYPQEFYENSFRARLEIYIGRYIHMCTIRTYVVYVCMYMNVHTYVEDIKINGLSTISVRSAKVILRSARFFSYLPSCSSSLASFLHPSLQLLIVRYV